MASNVISDAVTRITLLEGRTDQLERPRSRSVLLRGRLGLLAGQSHKAQALIRRLGPMGRIVHHPATTARPGAAQVCATRPIAGGCSTGFYTSHVTLGVPHEDCTRRDRAQKNTGRTE